MNPANPYLKQELDTEAGDGIDEPLVPDTKTQIYLEHAKKIINKVPSPDVPMDYSLNPYQGCEHGCIYCYARNAHQYWGYSAGLDFEQKIIVKQNAAELLEKELKHPKWKVSPIMFSGNTDCYQPIERKLEITRKCLEIFLKFQHPVGLITKNSLILRDIDILSELAKTGLVHVYITITTEDESLRRVLEPRTSTARRRLEVVKQLSEAGVPTGVMLGPIIPGLNNHEFPQLMEKSVANGALNAAYTLVRLNGSVKELFEQWIHIHFPDRADKILNQIREAHGGNLNDSQYGRRMRGEGPMSDSISQFFKLTKKRLLGESKMPSYNLDAFQLPEEGQLKLF